MKQKLTALYTSAQTQAIDRYAIDELGIQGSSLMSRAGHSAFELLGERWPEAQQIVIFCGGGNNGGDGYVVAALAHEAGRNVELRHLKSPERLKGDSLAAYEWAVRAGVPMAPYQSGELIVG
ncbi:MAG: bifunctional ADP-dependent NAD(P)H-hydrate dehydratase/NAD(P)H-hydrate epimerase, partial [Gammaproteobacteria bacterium]|nr:bifunctional ADP-dependent NAD(P)H-hydrate dehydratase/NAD(P)H-hydrate epimerase [Gammaproteobacteria bacterium]